ncbi:MAG: DUF1223 domain-containing protein [Bryobacteraceae bacterium]
MDLNIRTAGLVTAAGAFLILGTNILAAPAIPVQSAVLVELFTSEGCSSCPPADALLSSLDRSNSLGLETVVLSEHVDYWNRLGWKDPYSSPRFSERQNAYAGRFHLDGVYTPQMVVDGTVEFVGNDAKRARAAIAQAAKAEKAVIRIVPLAMEDRNALRVRVEVDALPASLQTGKAEVYLALAANEADSQVLHGENGGRRLHHVAVVRSLTPVGKIVPGTPFLSEVSLPLNSGTSAKDLRLVAFVQERGQGRVLGSTMHAATP